ncbi:MAG: potassium transporter Kup [Ignavibacteria bacterium]|nr:potassium transporter Kup [Ignavibacteria bacterium]
MSLTALGVVYGDIGTSPLYALRECFSGHFNVKAVHDNVLGVLSLIFWSLVMLISVWYLLVIMRADNEGEGGILALAELVRPHSKGTLYKFITVIGLFGAALLYGDGIITPAISVLSAMEGLKVATPMFEPYIIPLTLVILFLLFYFQKRGTGKVGSVFGPVTLTWFITIGTLGTISIIKTPEVLSAVNPVYAINFFNENGFQGFLILGAVFLVVTGGEALYADMGHFGPKPIRLAWYTIVLPSLLLNYFGQGALILREPDAISNPFYNLAPEWGLYPMVLLATMATVIASQAVISGAFSLTQQAVQLGFLPRVRIIHTSSDERGQIYIPKLNWILFIATALLVIQFKTSSNLAAAYGIAVTATMVITSLLIFFAMLWKWGWSLILAVLVTLIFISFDIAFFAANILKFFQGGWVPVLLAIAIFVIMTTWSWGRKKLLLKIQQETQPIENFIEEVMSIRAITTPGTAIYMSSNPRGTPPALVKNLKHNRILHKQIIVLSIVFRKIPRVNTEETIEIDNPTEGFYRVTAYYGFMDNANIMQVIDILNRRGIKIKLENTTFFLGREQLVVKDRSPFRRFRKRLFRLLSRNSETVTEFFNIPSDRVFEVGSQVEL